MDKKTPIDENMIQRAIQGVKYVVTGAKPDSWFGANQPMTPAAQDKAEGRQVDYLTALNLAVQPRDYDGAPIKDKFAQLRALADGYDLMRIVIETRKDQICSLDWTFKYKDEKEPDAKIEELNNFFAFPDKANDHESWLRAIVEDLFVIDAPCVYPRMTKGGELYSLELMDGSTIKKIIDDSGRVPLPPDPAYQQVLKGLAAVNYSRDELIYKPRNVRTHKLYGYSPVEQVLATINIALRRQVTQLNYYKEGNIPEALASVPESWSAAQLKEFQLYWDAIIEGNLAQKRKLKFIPHGVSYTPTKEPVLKDEFDEWLARVICYAFNVSNQAFAKMMNRATAQTAQETSEDEGLIPIKRWVKNFHDYILLKHFGLNDVEFSWATKEEADPLKEAQINQIYITTGVKQVNEVRGELGLDPLSDEELNPPIEEPIEEEPKEDISVGKRQALPILKSFSISKGGKDSKDERVTKAQGKVVKKLNKQLDSIKDDVTSSIKSVWDTESDMTSKDYLKQIDAIDFGVVGSAIASDIEKAYKVGSKIGFEKIDYEPTKEQVVLMNEKAVSWASDRGLELAKLSKTTKDMLRPTIEEALRDGLTVDELADKLQNAYAFSDARANMIARTELAFADEQGNFDSWKESGVVTGKYSMLGTNENHGEDDIANADQGVIDIDEPFQSGDMMPPYHPNCMCSLIPVVANEGK